MVERRKEKVKKTHRLGKKKKGEKDSGKIRGSIPIRVRIKGGETAKIKVSEGPRVDRSGDKRTGEEPRTFPSKFLIGLKNLLTGGTE